MGAHPEHVAVPRAVISPLNDEQREIALITDRHLVIDAGAGSGKTTLLIEKLMFEMGFGRIPGEVPERVLSLDQIGAITFTRKATGEIRDRLRRAFVARAESATGRDRADWAIQAHRVDEAQIETIDAFAARVIREYGALAGVEAGFDVLDEADSRILYAEVAERALLDGVRENVRGAAFLVKHFGYLRSRRLVESLLQDPALLVECARRRDLGLLDWERFLGESATDVDRVLQPHASSVLDFTLMARERLTQRLDAEGVLDFSHVLLRAADLSAIPEVQAAFRRRTRLLFVDEHQDTNLTQVRLLFQLCGIDEGAPRPPETRLVLVGDPKQGIYGFRGADISMWKRSAARLLRAGGEYRYLRRNHRSRPTLLRFFDDCFSRLMGPLSAADRPDYEVGYVPLAPVREDGSGPGVEVILAAEHGKGCDAVLVARHVRALLDHPDDHPVWDPHEGRMVPLQRRHIAILSRQLRGVAGIYEEALRAEGIDSYVLGGTSLYRREEVRDLAHLLRAVADPHDPFALTAFLRSPLGGVDDATLLQLAQVSTAAPRDRAEGSLYDALLQAEHHVHDETGAARARRAGRLLERLRGMRDRSPHHHLLQEAIRETGYRAFLAGAPDAPAGLRNLDKLLAIARRAGREPLPEFVRRLAERVRRADVEEEAPLYSPDDDLVTLSTIHQAKGLEWPVVFVVGLDQAVMWEIKGDEPRLSRDLGVVMDLEVVLRDGRSEARLQGGSGAWHWIQEQETRRQYAEAKRLFYVACTRARDRLYLCGALRRAQGREMFSSPAWMHLDGVERWLRHLYPALTRTGRAGEALVYGTRPTAEGGAPELDRAHIHREIAAPAQVEPATRGWVGEIGLAVERIPSTSRGRMPAGVERGMRSLEGLAVVREEFSASEVLKFATCPWMHYFGYRGSISAPSIEGDPQQALVNEILPRQRGDILHDYLRRHEDGWDEDRQLAEMCTVLLRHFQMPTDAVVRNARELLAHARDYLESDWYHRIRQTALEVLREVPFVFELEPGIRFRGKLDLLWREPDGWRILDFKTGVFRSRGERLEEEVAARTQEYGVQAIVYTLAALAALGSDEVREFVFFYTHPARSRSISVTGLWPAKEAASIVALIQRIRSADYGPTPEYQGRICDHCDYLRVCRPRNAPVQLGDVSAVSSPSTA
jgi:ATP-dependent helicase/nuclease subunit A